MPKPIMADVTVRLIGEDPDPWAILKRAIANMQDAGKSETEIDQFTATCLSEGADSTEAFLAVVDQWVVIESPFV